MMSTMVPTTAPAATPLESSASTITATAAIETAPSSAISSTVASTALWPLETCAWVATDACGIAPHKFFAGSVAVACTPCFAGKEDDIIFDHRPADHAFSGRRGHRCFRLHMLQSFVVGQVCTLRFAQSGVVRLVLLFRCFGFGCQMVFFFVFFVNFFGMLFVEFFRFLFVKLFLFFRFFLVELRLTRLSIGIRPGLRLLVLGFHQPRGKRCQFFFAQPSGAIALRFNLSFLGRCFCLR